MKRATTLALLVLIILSCSYSPSLLLENQLGETVRYELLYESGVIRFEMIESGKTIESSEYYNSKVRAIILKTNNIIAYSNSITATEAMIHTESQEGNCSIEIKHLYINTTLLTNTNTG